jgi:uncharacterized protein with PIN domain
MACLPIVISVMAQAWFRFYSELNDFLPRDRRQVAFRCEFSGRASVKDMFEALGVPHTEVDLILVDGVSVDFTHLVEDNAHISVFPVFESLDISTLIRLRPQPLRALRFVLDTHLGRLATDLRLLGFDTLYGNDYSDEELARLSVIDGQVLVTRDRGLLKRRAVTRGYYVRAALPRDQIVEVLRRFDLAAQVAPFSRCLRCNGLLEPVDKAAILDRLPAGTRAHFVEFKRCPACERVYWAGAHYEALQRRVDDILSRLGGQGETTAGSPGA